MLPERNEREAEEGGLTLVAVRLCVHVMFDEAGRVVGRACFQPLRELHHRTGQVYRGACTQQGRQ